jgi:hypothetical protein
MFYSSWVVAACGERLFLDAERHARGRGDLPDVRVKIRACVRSTRRRTGL